MTSLEPTPLLLLCSTLLSCDKPSLDFNESLATSHIDHPSSPSTGGDSYYGRDFQCTSIWFVDIYSSHAEFHQVFADDTNEKSIQITHLREQYRCTCFRILVIGRANAGKTTILEKVCGVGKGTMPIIIHDKEGKLLAETVQYTFSYSVSSR